MNKIITDSKFTKLDFHLSNLFAIYNDPNEFKLYLDIDYIDKVTLNKDTGSYNILYCSCTMLFHNAYDIEIDLDGTNQNVIEEISRENTNKPKNFGHVKKFEWDWSIELQSGGIYFKSIGFELFYRSSPFDYKNELFNINERGGISFYIPSTSSTNE